MFCAALLMLIRSAARGDPGANPAKIARRNEPPQIGTRRASLPKSQIGSRRKNWSRPRKSLAEMGRSLFARPRENEIQLALDVLGFAHRRIEFAPELREFRRVVLPRELARRAASARLALEPLIDRRLPQVM